MTQSIQDAVLKALGEKDPNIARCGIKLAGVLNIKESVDKIIPMLKHEAWQVRLTAVQALGLLEAVKAKPYLVKILGGETDGLRQRVISYAGLDGKPPKGQVPGKADPADEGEEVWQVKKAAAIALSQIDPDLAEKPLLDAMKLPNPQVAMAAMSGLTLLESPKAGERILPFLDSKDTETKKAAVICLGKLGYAQAAGALLHVLQDKNPIIRREAVIALNHIKVNEAIPAFVERMKDPRPEVRSVAAVALGNTATKEEGVITVLREALGDSSWEVRKAAVDALSNLGAVDAMDAVMPLIADSDEKVKRSAALGLLRLATVKEYRRYE
ncbi:MAG: HEAT repeat domain-containing protein [Deltaproteobacteria bacterium]|nr:HEAT repeat domain-containing protein [Deltaproteobacteria bacterium]